MQIVIGGCLLGESVLKSYVFIAVCIDMSVRCLEWDVIAHEAVRNMYLYCSDYL